MRGVIIAFSVYKNIGPARTNCFVQKFYGQNVTSHRGKYRSHKHGLLEDIPHVKLQRGVIILLKKDGAAVLNFLKEYNAETHVRDIILTPEDEKALANHN